MAQSQQAHDEPSLYSRLGGVYSIATVVEDLIDRVMVDPRLNANPRVDEAHHRVTSAGFKYLVTELLCSAAGGPQSYSGRAMDESHRHLLITAGNGRPSSTTCSRRSTSSGCRRRSRPRSRRSSTARGARS